MVVTLFHRIIFAVLIFVAMVLLMLLIQEPLYTLSLDWIKGYSKDWDDSSFASFMKIYTYLWAVLIHILATLYALLNGPKIRQLMYLNAVLLSYALCTFFKNLHNQLRPCWFDKQIPVIGMEDDFGNPSGHATNCGAVAGAALLLYVMDNEDFFLTLYERREDEKRRSSVLYSFPAKVVITVLLILSYLLVVYSRVYLGAHSLNQVLYGMILGTYCDFVIFYLFRADLIEFYKYLFAKKQKVLIKMYSMLLLAIALLVLAADTILYVSLRLTGTELDEETVQHVKTHIPTANKDMPVNAGLRNAGFGLGLIGAHLGVIFSLRYIDINPTRITVEFPLWKRIVRLLICLVVVAPLPLVLFILVPSFPPLYFFWFKTVIPSFALLFLYYAYGDYLMEKFCMLPVISSEGVGLMTDTREVAGSHEYAV